MFAKIQPVSVSLPPTQASILVVSNVGINPGSSANFTWTLYADESRLAPVASGPLALTGDAYAAWGTDDEYLYTYTATALGLTIIEIVPDAPPAPPAMVEPPPPVITEPPLHDGAPHAPVVDDTAAPVAPSVADSEEPK
jgi:hypothetical protein